VSFLVDNLQGPVDILKFRCQNRKVATDIRSYFFPTMNTFVFFNMRSNLLGNGIMVPEDIAKKSFHNVGFLGLTGRFLGNANDCFLSTTSERS